MLNYYNLPNKFSNFIKPFNLNRFQFRDSGHDWIYIRSDLILTSEGLKWFASRDIVLRPYASLFKIYKNSIGPIHTDPANFAFNFVVKGSGTMEWLSDVIGQKEFAFHRNVTYNIYKNVTDYKIIDRWSDNIALVRTNVEHRVVTTDQDRYCLSFRTDETKGIRNFDEMLKNLLVKDIFN